MNSKLTLFIFILVILVSCQPNNTSKNDTIPQQEFPSSNIEQPESKLNTDVLGLTLGKTSLTNGQGILKSKGYSPYEMNSTKPTSKFLGIDNVSFGGQTWTLNIFAFYKDKLMAVTFGKNCTSSEANKIFKEISSVLIEKYSDCLKTESSTELRFEDGNFCIQLNKTSDFVSLLYADEKLKSQMESDDKKEL